jgi:hypothetical protein
MSDDILPVLERTEPPPPYAQVTATTASDPGHLAVAIRDAFQDAMAFRGKLCEDAFAVPGFSGRKFRLFMNNLIAQVQDPRYLEIGVYHGASFCSAMAGNKLRIVGIDNWLGNWDNYDGKRDIFDSHLAKFVTPETDVTIMEGDFRHVEYARMEKFNIMFYDGSHSEKDQYDGVFLPSAAMEDNFILIVDDWNWPQVRKGTLDALRYLLLDIEYSVEVRTSFAGEVFPVIHGKNSEWHNGMLAAVISRRY